jgi:hypothetical protein
MIYPDGIIPWNIRVFKNVHDNFIQPLDEDQSFDLLLENPSFREMDALSQYLECTANIQWIIKTAQSRQKGIRAVGSGWSLSKVAMSAHALINTKKLRHKFALSPENYLPELLEDGIVPENYRFLQCGNTMIGISEYLEQQSNPPKSLPVSGASNGQTIVGGFSTGTHGAAIFFGALPEMIHGIHLITDPDHHYYIERSSNKITSPKFHEKLGAEVIVDDELFNAVLVSFGSFGVIHGVLIEVENKFLLEQRARRVAFDEGLERAVSLGDFSGIEGLLKYPISDSDHPIYHFDLVINPHDFEYNNVEKGVYMRIMHKTAYRSDYTPINPRGEGFTYGDDTLGLMQSVMDKIQAKAGFLNRFLVPEMVKALFNVAYNRPTEAIGTIGETFRNTLFRGQIFSIAIALDIKDVKKVIDLSLAINKVHKLAGVISMRFVKGTKATLGFTKWEKTCVLELDGVDTRINYRFFKSLAERMEKDDIHYTLHWGKINPNLNREKLNWMYGPENVISWKRQRSRVMSKEIQTLFNNEFLKQCGLDEFEPYDNL